MITETTRSTKVFVTPSGQQYEDRANAVFSVLQETFDGKYEFTTMGGHQRPSVHIAHWIWTNRAQLIKLLQELDPSATQEIV